MIKTYLFKPFIRSLITFLTLAVGGGLLCAADATYEADEFGGSLEINKDARPNLIVGPDYVQTNDFEKLDPETQTLTIRLQNFDDFKGFPDSPTDEDFSDLKYNGVSFNSLDFYYKNITVAKGYTLNIEGIYLNENSMLRFIINCQNIKIEGTMNLHVAQICGVGDFEHFYIDYDADVNMNGLASLVIPSLICDGRINVNDYNNNVINYPGDTVDFNKINFNIAGNAKLSFWTFNANQTILPDKLPGYKMNNLIINKTDPIFHNSYSVRKNGSTIIISENEPYDYASIFSIIEHGVGTEIPASEFNELVQRKENVITMAGIIEEFGEPNVDFDTIKIDAGASFDTRGLKSGLRIVNSKGGKLVL